MRKAALLGAIPPFLLKTDDNPEGVDGQVFEGIKAAIVNDRYAYFKDFLDNFYNVDVLGGTPDQRPGLAGELQRRRRRVAVRDLRLRRHLADRLPRRPAEDRRARCSSCTAPRTGSCRSRRPPRGCPALIADCTLVPVEGGPHNIGWTHPDEVNTALLEFMTRRG